MSQTDQDEIVLKEVVGYYKKSSEPYLLSELGNFFKIHNLEVPEEVQFKDYLKSRFFGSLEIVQHPAVPARIAIVTTEMKDVVVKQFEGTRTSDPDVIHPDTLPFSLLAAFCKVPEPGKRLYFRVSPPFRYFTSSSVLYSDEVVEIEDKFRPDEFAGVQARELTEQQKTNLVQYIRTWAKENKLDLERFQIFSPLGVSGSKKYLSATHNALQRLIESQDEDLRSRIKIPADIAKLLMQTD